jgi:4-hydroxy-3-polyprenylbenzoate decarboxylase
LPAGSKLGIVIGSAAGDFTNSRAVIDACRPWHWRDKFPAVNMPSPEERRVALAKFGYLMTR